MSDRRTEIHIEVDAVAYAIGRVIARKTIEADPGLSRLDGLGKASAAHEMARNMVPMLLEEAEAAIHAVEKCWSADERDEPENTSEETTNGHDQFP